MKKFSINKKGWKSFNIESIEFILKESKDYLQYTIDESVKITNRAYSFTILLSAILSSILAYTFSEIASKNVNDVIHLNLWLSIILGILIIPLVYLVFPRSIMAKGRKPIELARPDFLRSDKLSSAEIQLSMVIQEVENTQLKIDFNLSVNKKRRTVLKIVMYAMALLLILFVGSALWIVT